MTRRSGTTGLHGVVAALDRWSRQWSRRVRKRVTVPQGNAVVLDRKSVV